MICMAPYKLFAGQYRISSRAPLGTSRPPINVCGGLKIGDLNMAPTPHDLTHRVLFSRFKEFSE
jgi:hypothetical protein